MPQSVFKNRKYGVWVSCPICGKMYLVSKTVNVKVDCDCGNVFIHDARRKMVFSTGEIAIRKSKR